MIILIEEEGVMMLAETDAIEIMASCRFFHEFRKMPCLAAYVPEKDSITPHEPMKCGAEDTKRESPIPNRTAKAAEYLNCSECIFC